MATSTTTITNISNQVIPILVSSIAQVDASASSNLGPLVAEQVAIAAGAQLVIESARTDVGQLEQLRRKRLISYTAF